MNPQQIIEAVISKGSTIFISNENLQIKPSISQHKGLLAQVKKHKSDIITYLTKKWTDNKNLEEISLLPVLYFQGLPIPPILELSVPGIGMVFVDFRKKPKVGSQYGIVFDNRDVNEILKYYSIKKLTPKMFSEWCKQKQKRSESQVLYTDRKKTLSSNIALGLLLLSITAKLVSVRLEG